MAQHTISLRLSRSFNVYLRCRGIRYDPLPLTARHFHERHDGTGSDDSIKKIKQDINKLKGSSNATTLRVHRCGNAIEKQSQGKVVQPVAKSNSSFDSLDGPTKADNFHFKDEPDQIQSSKDKMLGSASSNYETENHSKEWLKKPKTFEKFDLSKFEKVCEESSQYIKNLLNGTSTKPDTIDSNASVKESDCLPHNQGLRMPSHQDIHGLKAPLKNEEKDQKIDIQIFYKTDRPENNVESSIPLNQAQNLEPKAKSSMPQPENEVSKTLLEDKSKGSHNQTFSDKISRITSEFNNSFVDNVTETPSKVPQNESTTLLKMNSDSSKMESRQKESSSSSENKPTVVSLDSTDEPYIFPTDTENLGQDKIDSKTSRQRSSDVHVHEFDVSSSKLDVSNEIKSIMKTHSAENKKRRSNDSRIDSRLPPFGSPKVSEKAEFSAFPSKAADHGIGNCPGKSPLRGTVGLLLGDTSMYKDTKSYGKDHKWDNSQSSGEIKMTPVTLTSDKPEHFANKIDQKNPMIGKNKVYHTVSRYNDDKSLPDSETVRKSNQLKTKKPKSSDNECQIAILENEFERTMESQIIEEFSRNNSDRDESASNPPPKINPVNQNFEVKKKDENQSTAEHSNLICKEKYNPVDTIFEVKSLSPNNYNMYSETAKTTQTPDKGTVISVTGNTIKSGSDLTPGELYKSSSECGTNEHILDNNAPKLKGPQMKIKRRNKLASKLCKRHKSKGEENSSKPKKPGNIGRSKSEIDVLDEGSFAETSQENILPPWKKISKRTDINVEETGISKSENGKFEEQNDSETLNQKNFQNDMDIKAPGELHNSKSEGDLYEERQITKPNRKIRNEMEFNPENYGDRFKLKKESLKQSKKKSKAETHLTHSDYTDDKSEVKKRRTKQFKEQDIEHNSNIRNKKELKSEELSKNFELNSEGNLSEVRRHSEAPKMSREDQHEENLKHAKLYISKAKRLHDIAKRKSLERKNRLRSGKGQKSKKKSRKTKDFMKPTENKMTLSEFLYGLVVKKDGNKKGGGNQRNFATYSALRCPISISHSWPLRYRKVHRFNSKLNSSNPKNNEIFISPEVVKQGLGAEAIHKERQDNEQEKKTSELKANDEGLSKSFEASKKHTKPLNDAIKIEKSTNGDSHTTIQGGSPQEQKHKRRLNKTKSKNEDIKIQIRGGSQEGNERRRADQINQNNKRGYNTLSQHIWQSIRYFFPVSSKISGKQN